MYLEIQYNNIYIIMMLIYQKNGNMLQYLINMTILLQCCKLKTLNQKKFQKKLNMMTHKEEINKVGQ